MLRYLTYGVYWLYPKFIDISYKYIESIKSSKEKGLMDPRRAIK